MAAKTTDSRAGDLRQARSAFAETLVQSAQDNLISLDSALHDQTITIFDLSRQAYLNAGLVPLLPTR